MNIDLLSTIRNVSADLTQLEMIAVVIEWKLRHSICNGTALKTFSDSGLGFKVLGFNHPRFRFAHSKPLLEMHDFVNLFTFIYQ